MPKSGFIEDCRKSIVNEKCIARIEKTKNDGEGLRRLQSISTLADPTTARERNVLWALLMKLTADADSTSARLNTDENNDNTTGVVVATGSCMVVIDNLTVVGTQTCLYKMDLGCSCLKENVRVDRCRMEGPPVSLMRSA